MTKKGESYWEITGKIFRDHKLGVFALFVVFLFCLVGVYAPFFASSKPFIVDYNGTFYFPFFRYLFYTGFYTKGIDIFFNLLMFMLPLYVISFIFFRQKTFLVLVIVITFFQFGSFGYLVLNKPKDPASDPKLNKEKYEQRNVLPSWGFELRYMTAYAKLNLVLDYMRNKKVHKGLEKFQKEYEKKFGAKMLTLWQMDFDDELKHIHLILNLINLHPFLHAHTDKHDCTHKSAPTYSLQPSAGHQLA